MVWLFIFFLFFGSLWFSLKKWLMLIEFNLGSLIMINKNELSALTCARILGVLYLLNIIAGILGQVFLRGSMVVPGDAIATVGNIVASPLLWRVGIVGDIFMHVLDIPMMVIIYILLKPVNKNFALLGLGFNLIQTAVLVANKMTLILPLLLLGNSEYMAAFTPAQINVQIMLLTDAHNYGFALGLIFFGMACLVYGNLIFRSGYLPKFIGVLITIAGISYLISSFTLLLVPAYYGVIFPVLVLCLVGELSFALWLVIKGVKVSEWEQEIFRLRL
jgi:hypothetical protein